jgi:hypothetical protein
MLDTTTPARAKPLNANTLAALPEGVRVWNDQIEYLDSAIATTPSLKAHFTAKRDALIRARDWLQSKIDTNTPEN